MNRFTRGPSRRCPEGSGHENEDFQGSEGRIDAVSPVRVIGRSSIKRCMIFVGCFLVALLAYGLVSPETAEMTPAARRAFFILVFAACLWITDAVPAFSVGILIIALQILLLGKPGGVFAGTEKDWEQFVSVLGHPLIWLFFGGFVMAAGLARTGLDRSFAAWLISRTGNKPAMVLAGVMGGTFFLSMFISNTATAAMMIAVVMPLLEMQGKEDHFDAGLVLGIAVSANLGGMGSLIGSPPNAIAVGNLTDLANGPQINFLDWMLLGLPLGLFLLAVAFVVVYLTYPSKMEALDMEHLKPSAGGLKDGVNPTPLWRELVMMVTMVLTVGLWLTSQWHHLPTAAVSFIPIVLLTTTGILGADEIRGLNYDVLFLLAGGLALGQMVMETGLSSWIVHQLPLGSLGVTGSILFVAYVAVVLSNFMSNTAAANILIPISLMVATGFEARMAVPIALASSSAMCLPISTPPNALAFATGLCHRKGFIYMGILLGVITPVLAVFWIHLIADGIAG